MNGRSACRMRMTRWRAHNLSPNERKDPEDERTIDYECTWYVGDDGRAYRTDPPRRSMNLDETNGRR